MLMTFVLRWPQTDPWLKCWDWTLWWFSVVGWLVCYFTMNVCLNYGVEFDPRRFVSFSRFRGMHNLTFACERSHSDSPFCWQGEMTFFTARILDAHLIKNASTYQNHSSISLLFFLCNNSSAVYPVLGHSWLCCTTVDVVCTTHVPLGLAKSICSWSMIAKLWHSKYINFSHDKRFLVLLLIFCMYENRVRM
jgi:hypothetical protein